MLYNTIIYMYAVFIICCPNNLIRDCVYRFFLKYKKETYFGPRQPANNISILRTVSRCRYVEPLSCITNWNTNKQINGTVKISKIIRFNLVGFLSRKTAYSNT